MLPRNISSAPGNMRGALLSKTDKPHRTWRLHALLLALGLAICVPLAILLLNGIENESNRIQSRVESTAMNLAQIAAHTLERQLDETQQFLDTLANRDSVRALSSGRCDPVFSDFQKSHPNFTALTSTSLDGHLICSSLGNTPNRPLLKESLIVDNAALSPLFHLGHAQKGFITGRWVLPISRTLFDNNGVINGVLAAWIDLVHFNPLNASTLNQLPANTLTTILDEHGVILGRSHDAEKWVGANRSAYPQTTQALLERQGVYKAISKIDGIERLHAVMPVEGTRWVISVGIPVAVMDDELIHARRLWMSLISAFVLFIAFIAWLVGRHIARPIQGISNIALRVQHGNLEQRIPPGDMGHIAEINDVSIQFNSMLDTLAADQQRLEQSEANLRTLFEEMRNGFALHEIILDETGKAIDYQFVTVNPAFEQITGLQASEIVGKRASEILPNLEPNWIERYGRVALTGEPATFESYSQDLKKYFDVHAFRPRPGQFGVMIIDITERRRAEETIHNLAFFDPLTQLPNRRLLLDRLHRAVAASARRNSCGAVMLIDLDNFKLLNETAGHEVGDLLLIEVAQRLRHCVRDQDSVARQGGDEFIIILEDLGSELHLAASHAEQVAEKILESLRETYQLGLVEHHSQASIGISMYHDQGESAEEILKRADNAMYRAKEAGRNTVRFFDPAMQSVLENRLQLEIELRHAIPGDELRLHYQAQVDEAGRIVGAEVLIRWQHPLRGLVAPVQFIPLAEDTGLILPIGTWVMEMACAQLKAWEKLPAARHLKLAVNVSPRQFRQTDFVSMTQNIVKQSGIDPCKLKLELTESIVIDNVADTIEKMHQLKTLGLSFSMDDFGTGYSSLSYLKRLPLDQLKIDQSFVRDISSDANDAAIVETIITMGNTLGMNVIAEGVETEVQHQFLKQRGCLTYQGYLFSRPVPLNEFEGLLVN